MELSFICIAMHWLEVQCSAAVLLALASAELAHTQVYSGAQSSGSIAARWWKSTVRKALDHSMLTLCIS